MSSNFERYVPKDACNEVQSLIETHNICLKIVNQRQTKHGDFRRLRNGQFEITVNNSLNSYQFLLTLVHEIAHQVTFQKYGRTRPHGKEWKQTFQHLMLPFLRPEIYPEKMLSSLANYLKNPKASTDSDVKLSLALKANTAELGKNFIFALPLNTIFIYKNKKYQRGMKKRTKYECLEIETNRLYLFHQNAEVTIYEEQ